MADELRAAVVGCGGAGTNHAGGYERADRAELTAVCDIDEDRARDLAAEHDVPWYTDQTAMQDAESPDLVSVATPETRHVEPAVTALDSGADVLCEKILAGSLADGRRMVETAERTGRVLGVDYNYRHIPVFERVADAVGGVELGEPKLVSFDVHAFCWHHAVDLLRFVLGEPTAVQAAQVRDREWEFWEQHDDLLYVPAPTALASMEFPKGIASLSASRHGGGPDEHMIDVAVRGTEGRTSVTGIRISDTSGEHASGTLADDLDACESITLAESFYRSVRAFVDARHAGERPPTTGEDGLAVMEIESAVVESARDGRRVEL